MIKISLDYTDGTGGTSFFFFNFFFKKANIEVQLLVYIVSGGKVLTDTIIGYSLYTECTNEKFSLLIKENVSS